MENHIFDPLKYSSLDYVEFFNSTLERNGCDDRVSIHGPAKYSHPSLRGAMIFEIKSPTKEDFRIFFSIRRQSFLAFRQGIEHRMLQIIDEYLLNGLRISGEDLVVDCGANIGELGLALRYFSMGFPYLGFEPGPLEFEALLLNNMTIKGDVRRIALAHKDGGCGLFYKPDYGDSSIIKISNSSCEIDVTISRLDSILATEAYKGRRVGLFKLEAEGAEPEVLQGATQALRNIRYISADLGFERGIDQGSTCPAVTNFLLAHEFAMQRLHRRRLTFLYGNRAIPSGGGMA